MIVFPPSWSDFVVGVNVDEILLNVESEYNLKKIFPPQEQIFRALELLQPHEVKVVIIGQDPYHGEGQACGLAFSVSEGVKFPPSLVNIFKEVITDTGGEMPTSGDLCRWAKQGVLLLNSTLTVESGRPTSHKNMGWECLTQNIIDNIGKRNEGVVYILWGSFAQRVGKNIDRSKNCVITGVHPSPLSSYRGFFGSKPFSEANKYLISKGKTAIKW